MKAKLIPSKVKRLFIYNSSTGRLRWNHRPMSDFETKRICNIWNTRFAGIIAGYVNMSGYIMIAIDGTRYYAHRIAYYLMTNKQISLEVEIDHINGDRSDNRWCNLRLATSAQNNHNRGIGRNNTSNWEGVSYHSLTRKWRSRISCNGKCIYLGLFNEPEPAYLTFLMAKEFYHKKFNRETSCPELLE